MPEHYCHSSPYVEKWELGEKELEKWELEKREYEMGDVKCILEGKGVRTKTNGVPNTNDANRMATELEGMGIGRMD